MQVVKPGGALRHRMSAAAVAIAAGASLAVAGCGGSSGSGAGTPSQVAGFIPAGAPVYVEVSTDADGAQWAQALAIAKRFPGYGTAVASLADELSSGGVSFDKDIKPFLGDDAALGVLDVTSVEKGKRPEGSFVAALDLADGQEQAFLAAIQKGADPVTRVGQHAGVDLYGDEDAVVGVVDGVAVFAQTADEVGRAIDAHRSGADATMAGSERLADALAELPDETLAQGFVDVGALIAVAEREGGQEAVKALADSGLGKDASFGFSLSAEQEGLRVKAVGMGLGEAAGRSESFTPGLLDHVPADAIAYVGLKNAYRVGEQAIAQASGDPEIKKGLDQIAVALPLLGIDTEKIKALTSGEHAFVVTSGTKVPGVVAALEVEDGATAAATLDTVRGRLPSLLGAGGAEIPAFAPVELANGVTGWRSAIDPKAGIVYGVDGDIAYIGTLAAAVREVQAPGATLADSEAFTAATRQMPNKVDSVVWIDGARLVDALDALGALTDAPAEARANLAPLASLAAWSTGGDTPTFEAFLTVR
jgi:hypothetical protein